MAGAGFWPLVPLQVESWGWPSLAVIWKWNPGQELGQEALEGWVWGCYPPLLYTDILISGTTKTRVRKSRLQSLWPFGKALDCIRKWIQVDRDSGLVQPLLG